MANTLIFGRKSLSLRYVFGWQKLLHGKISIISMFSRTMQIGCTNDIYLCRRKSVTVVTNNEFNFSKIMKFWNIMSKKSLSKEELVEQLKVLAQADVEESLHMGAMCYSPAPPEIRKVKCESCGKEIEEWGWDGKFEYLKSKVAKIADMGYDAKVKRVCSDCANKLGLRDEDGDKLAGDGVHTVFYFKTKEQPDYTISVDNYSDDYNAVIAFLENNPIYSDSYDATHAVKESLDVIKRMTGISIE